jgi:hypothetical protein
LRVPAVAEEIHRRKLTGLSRLRFAVAAITDQKPGALRRKVDPCRWSRVDERVGLPTRSRLGLTNMKCRACKAPLKETPTVTTPTCPYCGAYWPGGLGGLWVIGASLVAYVLYRLFVEPG